MLRNIPILWDDLLGAFTNMEPDKIYFLDRTTGEIFFVATDQDDAFWEQMERQQDRFLEIPGFDHATERQILAGFIDNQNNAELRRLLTLSMSGQPPYASAMDILSFFPEEEAQLAERMDLFLSNRVRSWLERHNLSSLSTSTSAVN